MTNTEQHDRPPLIGGSILGLLTSGMYVNPLTIYREYLQNSADAVAQNRLAGRGKVNITIDAENLRVSIRDNGRGLSHHQAIRELMPVAQSGKNPKHDRGFRGVGRLAGIAFGKSVTFLTRQNSKQPVTKVVWDGEKLRAASGKKLSAENLILGCVTVEKMSGENYPDNFFEVNIDEISRHAAAYLLNHDSVKKYLGEVCSVPFSDSFSHASCINKMFNQSRLFVLEVRLAGDDAPVNRPHKNELFFTENRKDRLTNLEKIEIPALGSDDCAAIGWIAHSSYRGALPKQLGVRGIRARVGNIQIGDEAVFDHLFMETRFNRWCVAEIHVLDPRIVPNGRRDYFEPSAHLRNLENRLGAICRNLEKCCREASQNRNRQRQFQAALDELEAASDIAESGYLSASATVEAIDKWLLEVAATRVKYAEMSGSANFKSLAELEKKLKNIRVRRKRSSLTGVAASDVSAYKKIFKILAETSSSPRRAKELIEQILKSAAK